MIVKGKVFKVQVGDEPWEGALPGWYRGKVNGDSEGPYGSEDEAAAGVIQSVATDERKPPFAIGSLVQLKSGGPHMTVALHRRDRKATLCNWFEGNKLQKDWFMNSMLKRKAQ